jgi:hypothetical protein
MTTIITRLYSDQATARTVQSALLQAGQDQDTIQIITRDAMGGAEAAMRAARVPAPSAAAYAAAMSSGEALVVVHAPFNPMGTARDAIKIVNRHPSIKVGLGDEDVYIREYASTQVSGNVLTSHPLIMSNPFGRPSHGHILGNNPIIHSRERTSAIRGGSYMSRFFWPMKLLSRAKDGTSAIQGGFLFSNMFGIPLLARSWGPRDEVKTII